MGAAIAAKKAVARQQLTKTSGGGRGSLEKIELSGSGTVLLSATAPTGSARAPSPTKMTVSHERCALSFELFIDCGCLQELKNSDATMGKAKKSASPTRNTVEVLSATANSSGSSLTKTVRFVAHEKQQTTTLYQTKTPNMPD
jgi:hypothetical protein